MSSSSAEVLERIQFLSNLAQKLVAECGRVGVSLRLLGGIAVYLKCPAHRDFLEATRSLYGDIDAVTVHDHIPALVSYLAETGWEEDATYRMLAGNERRVFYGPLNATLDLYIDDLRLAQAVPLRTRLMLDCPTISITDLLLSRVQKVCLARKDVVDICVLLSEHETEPHGGHGVDLRYVTALASRRWNWWRAWHNAFAQLDSSSWANLLPAGERGLVVSRQNVIRRGLASIQPSLVWRLRSLIGDRVQWYDEVEAVDN